MQWSEWVDNINKARPDASRALRAGPAWRAWMMLL